MQAEEHGYASKFVQTEDTQNVPTSKQLPHGQTTSKTSFRIHSLSESREAEYQVAVIITDLSRQQEDSDGNLRGVGKDVGRNIRARSIARI